MAIRAQHPDYLGEGTLERQAVIERGRRYHGRKRVVRPRKILRQPANQLEISGFSHRQRFEAGDQVGWIIAEVIRPAEYPAADIEDPPGRVDANEITENPRIEV